RRPCGQRAPALAAPRRPGPLPADAAPAPRADRPHRPPALRCPCEDDRVEIVNVITCEPDDTFGSGAFHSRVYELTERLGGRVIGAGVWDVPAGFKSGPYHYHPGVEEWLYAVSGAPVLRSPAGERTLAPGELVAFAAGPEGAHTVHGPGRVVIFS